VKVFLVLNGSSVARHGGDIGERLAAVAREAGHEPTVVVTKSLDHLRESVAKEVADGAEAVFSGGGDGTLYHVLNVPGVERTVLAPLPLGTINAWLRSARADTGNPLRCLRQLLAGGPADCWTGRVGDRRFACFASIGFDARTIHETSVESKARLRGAAFALKGLALLPGSSGRAIHGDVAFGPGGRETKADSLVISKIRNYAGRNAFHVRASDRGFEAVWTRRDSALSLVTLMGYLATGGPARGSRPPKSLGHHRHFERVVWNSAEAPPVQLDGEPVTLPNATDLLLTLEQSAQRCFLPK
jgi:diacylglycerol kinase family enzyme